MSGTGKESDYDLLCRENVNIDELYPNVITLCGQGDRRVVGQILQSFTTRNKSTYDEIRTVKLANAIVSLGHGTKERFYRRINLRLTW